MSKEVFHTIRACNRTFDSDQWAKYCSETRNDDSKRIRNTFGKYTFNDFDICLNPEFKKIVAKSGSFDYYVIIKWADCGNGLWSYGIDYCTGSCGGSFGVSWADRTGCEGSWRNGYPSECECLVTACDYAVKKLLLNAGTQGKQDAKLKQLIGLVEDYKKSLTRPKVVQLELF